MVTNEVGDQKFIGPFNNRKDAGEYAKRNKFQEYIVLHLMPAEHRRDGRMKHQAPTVAT
jgi:hypothetical protein